MKGSIKKHVSIMVVFAMVIAMVAGFVPTNKIAAADLSPYLNMEFGIKYTGTVEAVPNADKTAWNIEYFNVEDSAYAAGDEFYLSFKISGANVFQQVAAQSSVNGWDWEAAPKIWAEEGIQADTVVAGKITATDAGDNLAFKIQLDHVVEDVEVPEPLEITLTDLYIMKIGNTGAKAEVLPENMQIDLQTPYSGPVKAVLSENKDAYEIQYFNVIDSEYKEGDTYIFSYTLEGAQDFKQIVTQSNLNDWDWDASPKLWAGEGLPESQDFTGAITAVSSGESVSFKIRVDTPVNESAEEPETPAESINMEVNNLIVVKVANTTEIPLNEYLEISKDRYYGGEVAAVYDEDTESWNIQYFNVRNSAIKAGDKFNIEFTVSGAQVFKQMVVQSNVNGWSWEEATKVFYEEGIPKDYTFKAVIEATEDCEQITFKLWFDSPVDPSITEEEEKTDIIMTLSNLIVTDATGPDEPVETAEPVETEAPVETDAPVIEE